jgi:hypothetical protein
LTGGQGWFEDGSALSVAASASPGWHFESWTGSSPGGYTGTNSSFETEVTGPVTENATFYVQLTVTADSRTDIAYSFNPDAACLAFLKVIFGSCSVESGSVQAGTSKTLYIPPGSNVTLTESPSLFVYSFGSWQGTGIVKATKPSLALVVDSPSSVTGTASYNYPVILGVVVTVALLILVASLSIRSRRKKNSDWAFPPT